MAKIVYVNSLSGDNANNGTSALTPKKTIAGARSATAAAPASTSSSPDIVMIAPGVYPEPNTLFSAASDNLVVYMADGTGEVVIDFEERAGIDHTGSGLFSNWRVTVNTHFIGIRFRNMYGGAFPTTNCIDGNPQLRHCVFQQRDGAAGTGIGLSGVSGLHVSVDTCSFYNLSIAIGAGSVAATIYSSYFVACTTPILGTATRDYNAFPGNTETNGINTSTGANPGFRSTAGEDFRLDPTTLVDYQTFLTGGRFGGRIGAMGKPGIYYDARNPQLRMITKTPTGTHAKLVTWEDDTSYVPTGTGGIIVQDGTTNELQIDLAATPTTTDARVMSDVFDLGASAARGVMNITLGKFEDLPNGAALDIDDTLPEEYEYRVSDTAFLKTDAGPLPGVSIDWAAFEQSDYLNLSSTYRYLQIRVTFRTDHTNA